MYGKAAVGHVQTDKMEDHTEINNRKVEVVRKYVKSPSFKRSAIGILIGGVGGFLYYYFKDCDPAVCAIAGNPYYSSLWGGFMGLFMVNSPCARGRC
jgi:hypothetical protein